MWRKRRIAINTGFKEFESAQRTLAGIEPVSLIRMNQIENSKANAFKTNKPKAGMKPMLLPTLIKL